jgi:ankyrin repeat protein
MAIYLRDNASSEYLYDTSEGNTPIGLAALKQSWQVVIALSNVRTDSTDRAQYNVALILAVQKDRTDMAAYLVQMGATIEWVIRNDYEYKNVPALHVAILNRNPEMVKIVLSSNPDLSLKSAEGLTAIQLAMKLAERRDSYSTVYWQCVALLLKAEALLEEKEQDVSVIPCLGELVKSENLKPLSQDQLDSFKKMSHNKDQLLSRIKEMKEPELQQKAYWQALVSQTALGQLFFLKKSGSLRSPDFNHGHLKSVALELKKLLNTTSDLHIDPAVRDALVSNASFSKNFPELLGRLAPSNLNERAEGQPEKTNSWSGFFSKKTSTSIPTVTKLPVNRT